MIIRRAVIASVVVATGIVATSGVAAAQADGVRSSVVLASTHNSKQLTEAQFVAEANALCSASVMAFKSVLTQFASLKTSHSPAEIAAFLKVASPIMQAQINKTRALKPPKQIHATVTKMLNEDQTELNMVKSDPALMGASNSPFEASGALALKLGIVGVAGSGPCSKGSP